MSNMNDTNSTRKSGKHERTSVIFGSIGAGIVLVLLILGLAFFGGNDDKPSSHSDNSASVSSQVQSSGQTKD